MMARLSPLSPLPKEASDVERQYAEQSNRVVQLAKAGQFENMPTEQQTRPFWTLFSPVLTRDTSH